MMEDEQLNILELVERAGVTLHLANKGPVSVLTHRDRHHFSGALRVCYFPDDKLTAPP